MFRLILATIVSVLFASQAQAAPAAQYAQTFVSRAGSDSSNLCGDRTAPCATIANAVAYTGVAGLVSCVDRDGNDYGFTITQSVVIDCPGAVITGLVTINTTNSGDTLQTVHIRGLLFSGKAEIQKALVIQKAINVFLEDLIIDGYTVQGITDTRTTPGRLIIKNSTVRQIGGVGIAIAATGGTNVAVLDNVTSAHNNYGLAVGNHNNVRVSRSTFAQNTRSGIEADPGGQVSIDSSTIAHNFVYGLENYGNMAISNSDLTFNQTPVTGTVTSFGNNRLFGNGLPGTAFTGGAASSDRGQQ